MRWLAPVLVAVAIVAACTGKSDPTPPTTAKPSLTQDELMDPESCRPCHQDHTREWSGSMHAYASDDPVFLAMNARFQRETRGQFASFCVQCHAPMAVKTGSTKDGSNLAQVPKPLHGVTCFFCHTVDAVKGAHNNPLELSADLVLRADITDPKDNGAHAAGYSALHDREQIDSSQLCGTCHDVQNANGVDVEKTFAEWKGALYAHDVPGQKLTCSACHMPGGEGAAANVPAAPKRRVHDHSMPGVDIALTDFPEKDAQRALVQANLDPAIVAKLCVKPPQGGPPVDVTLDNAFVGHSWPSGATHDRRAWVELIAYAAGSIVFQSGVVPDDQPIALLNDPNLWLLREKLFDAQHQEVRMLWQATSAESAFLPVATTNQPQDPGYYHAVTKSFDVPPTADRITARVRIQPIGLEVLDDLIKSGDLDPQFRAKMPTFTLAGSVLEWKKELGYRCLP